MVLAENGSEMILSFNDCGAAKAAAPRCPVVDNGGTRSGVERRGQNAAHPGHERRSGRDRRSGIDRRGGSERRSRAIPLDPGIVRDENRIERRDYLRRPKLS
jgi:hypothetical protein